jgi:hypothetical protein
MLCRYEETALRFPRGASTIEERFLAAFRARKQRAKGTLVVERGQRVTVVKKEFVPERRFFP